MPNAPEQIRVMMAAVPRLTADIVMDSLREHADISIVEVLRDEAELAQLADTSDIDVVLTSRTSRGVVEQCRQLLFATSSIPVIALCGDGRLEIYDRRDVRESGMESLSTEIRTLAARMTAPLEP